MLHANWVRLGLVAVCITTGAGSTDAAEAADQAPAGLQVQVLFETGRGPKIAVAKDGTVLAFAESCRWLRRSEDQGASWSEPAKINSVGSGNVVVDEQSGDILIVCPRECVVLRSKDSGRNWSKEDITIKSNAIGHGSGQVPANVGASESGVTLQHGKFKGRLLMPARIQPPFGDNSQDYWQYNYNTSIYSDDGGKTWQVGGPVQSGTGEGTLAELSDGRIYFNSRCHMAVDHRRRIAWSYDGGNRWVDWEVSDQLFEVGGPHYFKYGRKPSYGCNAGLARVPSEVTGGRDILLYSAPDNPGKTEPFDGRTKMTVWASIDGAKNWEFKRLVFGGISSYSSIEADKSANVYVLFESGNSALYQNIRLAHFPLASLVDLTTGEQSRGQ